MRTALIGVMLALLIATATGCSSSPPEPRITAGNVVVPAVLSTHCWSSCADYPSPPQHLKTAKYQTPPGCEGPHLA